MEGNDDQVQNPENIINILLATDIHLGHLETDPVRADDSFVAFEEVLSLAVQYDVDMVLLGGDLFDHAKPTPSCLLRCTHLLRQYCLGERPVALELLSDAQENFGRRINYEEPDLNVAYPVFTIHGNHDDPVGRSSVSSLDILAGAGLVNYFGKWTDYTRVQLAPVLLRKGDTRLALFGLGHLKDQRLSRLFKESKVEMQRPENDNEWFNLLVLHQNRADRGPSNYISEEVLPDFLDFVLWGHEHDCRVIEEWNERRKFYVSQPGSTVATSLASGEALPKHCALLQVHNKKFKLTPIPLKTVRPFIFRTIVLSEENLGSSAVNESDKVQEFLKTKVQEAIDEARNLRSGDERQPQLPLVRLNVFYEHEGQNFNKIRFGQQYNETIANPQEVLQMKREKRITDRKVDPASMEQNNYAFEANGIADVLDVEMLLQRHFELMPPEQRPLVLCARAVADAVRDYTRKNNDETLRQTFEAHRRHCIEDLMTSDATTEADVAERLRACRMRLDETEMDSLRELMRSVPAKPVQREPVVEIQQISDDDDDVSLSTGRAVRGRATAIRGPRGRPSRGPRGPRGGRLAVQREPSPPPAPQQPERRTPRRAAAQRSSTWLQDYMNTSSGRPSRTSNRSQSPFEVEDSD